MSDSQVGLVLHLKLDEMEDGKVIDSSGTNEDIAVQGEPTLVPDDTLGACLSFDGAGDYLEVSSVSLTGDSPPHTIELWVRVDEHPQSKSSMLLLGQAGEGSHHWVMNPDGTARMGTWSGAELSTSVAVNEWTHLAVTYDGKQLSGYVNGSPLGEPVAAAFKLSTISLTLAKGAQTESDFKGRLASLRVYSRALTAEEIGQDIEADQTAYAAFKRGHPISFSFHDRDEEPVIYIVNDRAGRNMHLEITNSSDRAINLAEIAGTSASSESSHFELRFRSGTLPDSSLEQIKLTDGSWKMAAEKHANALVSLYFLGPAGLSLNPGEKIKLGLRGVSADGRGGSRGTRVEMVYRNLARPGDTTMLAGNRIQHLNIINDVGRSNIPLRVGFVGSNTVLNDGVSMSTLTLLIANPSQQESIALNDASTGAPTTFIISFDVQAQEQDRPWALGEQDDVTEIHVLQPDGWPSPTREGAGQSPEWTIKNQDKRELAPGEGISIVLSKIKSSLPAGQTNLYLRYENFPEFSDGQFICTIEKSPILFRETDDEPRKGYVGIGTSSPRSELDTGKGVLTGAANDYYKAQLTMSGGGIVTWRGPENRLGWTDPFICTSMGGSSTFPIGDVLDPPNGQFVIPQPTTNIREEYVYDKIARDTNADGIVLYGWEALYAVHTVGEDSAPVSFRIVHSGQDFFAPSNWLLVAVVNGDDETVKLGTGAIISARSSSSKGSLLPRGAIILWSGKYEEIPYGWALCDGANGTPDLQSRFVVGAGPGGKPSYSPGQSGDPDQHNHVIGIPARTFYTDNAGSHDHAPPSAWYDRRALEDVDALGEERFNAIDRGSGSTKSARTAGGGDHHHPVQASYDKFNSESTAFENRPRWFALCYIMKL
jgi:concanavalin A-like lectin/glucanase superfamily protein